MCDHKTIYARWELLNYFSQNHSELRREKPIGNRVRGQYCEILGGCYRTAEEDGYIIRRSVPSVVRGDEWNRKASRGTLERDDERIIGFSQAMFEHVYEYRQVNRALLGSNAEAVVRRHVHSALVALVQHEVKLEFQRRKRANYPVLPELLTHFLVSTCISVLAWWLAAKNPVPPKDIDAAYRHLVLPCLASIFG